MTSSPAAIGRPDDEVGLLAGGAVIRAVKHGVGQARVRDQRSLGKQCGTEIFAAKTVSVRVPDSLQLE